MNQTSESYKKNKMNSSANNLLHDKVFFDKISESQYKYHIYLKIE
jgi:hypothetical protein